MTAKDVKATQSGCPGLPENGKAAPSAKLAAAIKKVASTVPLPVSGTELLVSDRYLLP